MHIHGGIADDFAFIVVEFHEECVVLLEESRAYPVEVHHLAVLMLVEKELRGELRCVQAPVHVNTRMDVIQIETHLHIALLRITCQEKDIGQRVSLWQIETLELCFLQFQDGRLRL